MVISGLVFTLAGGAGEGAAELAKWAQAGQLTLGERMGPKWPAVLEAESEETSREVYEALRELPGVAAVDVVFVQFEAI